MNWPLASFHQIVSTVYVPKDLAIDTALADDPDADLMGPFTSTDANVKPLCVCKTINLPVPIVRIFLKWDLTPVEAWTRLHGAIVDGGLKTYCCPIIDWIRVSLTLSTVDGKSPLDMPHPTVLLADEYLLRNQHHILIRHHPGLYPSFQRV